VSDATILGSSSLDDYPVIEPLPSYNKTKDSNIAYNGERYCSLIHADGVTNVTIRGTGTVDGQGPLWWKRIHELNHTRPHLVEIMNGKDVTITGVTLRNSPMWTLHPIYCTNVLVDGIKIINPIPSPNTDGIDPDSSTNVMISNNYISTA
jgi:polygalacturonase